MANTVPGKNPKLSKPAFKFSKPSWKINKSSRYYRFIKIIINVFAVIIALFLFETGLKIIKKIPQILSNFKGILSPSDFVQFLFTMSIIAIAILGLFGIGLVILLDRFKKPIILPWIKKSYHKLHSWAEKISEVIVQKGYKFKRADNKEKIRILIIPLTIIIFILLLRAIQPFIENPTITIAYPENESIEVPVNSDLEITFSKPMNKGSVESAFLRNSTIKGAVTWINDYSLIFTPSEVLERETSYTLNLEGSRSRYLIPLIELDSITFRTISQPKVLVATPKTVTLEDNAPITIIFDRPMIPLTTVDEKEQIESPIIIKPDIAGFGRWIGTSVYQFKPEKPYDLASTYTVTVKSGLKSEDEGVILDDYSWEFSSPRPKVVKTSPMENYLYANPYGEFSIYFNQPIDITTAQEYITFYETSDQSKTPIPIDIYKKTLTEKEIKNSYDTNINEQTSVLVFKPTQALEREVSYTARIEAGLKPETGTNGLETPFTYKFTTTGLPKLLSTNPKNNAQKVGEQRGISVNFATPMDSKSFEGKVRITPTPDKPPTTSFYSYGDTHSLSINTYLGRSQTYTVTIPATVKDQYGIALGKSYTFSFTTDEYTPSITIIPSGTYFGTFYQGEQPRIVSKVINTPGTTNYKLYKLTEEDFLDLYRKRGGYSNACPDDGYKCRNWQSYDPSNLEFIKEWTEKYEANHNTPTHVITKVSDTNGQNLPSGLYFIDITNPTNNSHDNMVMIISKSTAMHKYSSEQVFIWTADQKSGDSISDMDIKIIDPKNNTLLTGKTNGDGILMTEYKRDTHNEPPHIVIATKDDDYLLYFANWNSGINKYDFDSISQYGSYDEIAYTGSPSYITTDRPLYRPGQKVYFKGTTRIYNGSDYDLPNANYTVYVSVKDASNSTIYDESLLLSSHGSYSGEVLIPEDGPLGNYRITIKYDNESYNTTFQVEEYKLPDLSLSSETDRPYYVDKETARVDVTASYYFGAPISNEELSWTLSRQEYNFNHPSYKGFSFSDDTEYRYYYYDRPFADTLTSGVSTTDLNGNAEVELKLDLSEVTSSQRYVLDGYISDESNQSASVTQDFIVHKGDFYIGTKVDSYSNKVGKETKIDVATVDYNGKPLPNTEYKVNVYTREWKTIREKDPDTGFFYYKSEIEEELVESIKGDTDKNGLAQVTYTPEKGGSYRIQARTLDAKNRPIRASTFMWVSGSSYSSIRSNNDRILIIPDKEEYKVNEQADLLINTPYEGNTKTIITRERKNIMDYKIIDISQESNIYSMILQEQDVPNIYISAFVLRPHLDVKNPTEFKMGYTSLSVENPSNKINVSVKADKPKYDPQENVTLEINAKDGNGKPVQAEFSIGVVDKALWDLSYIKNENIYNYYYKNRPLGIRTSTPLTKSIDRINANTNLGAKGGSGGGGTGEAGFDTTRKEFPETAYWNAHVETNSNGYAEVKFQLPDNLTTWKVDAIGSAGSSAFGATDTTFITTKDVLVRPFLPRFLAVGDTSYIGGIFTNTSDKEITATVTLSADSVDINQNRERTVTIPAFSDRKILWQVVTPDVEKAGFIFSIITDEGKSDTVQLEIPVVFRYTPQSTAVSGKVEHISEETIAIPEGTITDIGDLSVTVTPALGLDQIDNYSYFNTYPYESVENSSSALIAYISAIQVMKEAGLDSIGDTKATSLEYYINDKIQKIVNAQKFDGGWSWRKGSTQESQPYYTAHALYALTLANNAGYTVQRSVLIDAEDRLYQMFNHGHSNLENSDIPYLLYVLSIQPGMVTNSTLTSELTKSYNDRHHYSNQSNAYLALAMNNTSKNDSRVDRIKDELLTQVRKETSTAYWDSNPRLLSQKRNDRYYYSYGSSSVSTTATILKLLSETDPKLPILDEAVSFINYNSNGDYYGYCWGSTLNTSKVLDGLSSYLTTRNISKLDENYKVELNGQEILSGYFNKNNIMTTDSNQIPLKELNTAEGNTLTYSKSGKGDLYYTNLLTYYQPSDIVNEEDQGIAIVRELIDMEGNIIEDNKLIEGEEYWVRLYIATPYHRNSVTLEDFLPAGAESLNESLQNVRSVNEDEVPEKSTEYNKNQYGEDYGNARTWYFHNKQYHDDKTAMFASRLPRGLYEIKYRIKATTPGTYVYPPARIFETFTPDVFGHTEGGTIEVVAASKTQTPR